MVGGKGNDNLYGGTGSAAASNGNDTFVWSKGDGNDTIYAYGADLTEVDTLELTDVISTDVALTRTHGSNNLIVLIISTGEIITVRERFQNITKGYGIEAIEFSDGVTWTLDDILARTTVEGTAGNNTLAGKNYRDNIYGFAGNDVIDGNGGDDVIVGGLGNDTLRGDAGNDTYIWSKGDGNDTINDTSASLNEVDTLVLTDVSSADAVLSRVGNDLTVVITETGETITVTNRFISPGSGKGIEVVSFSDGVSVAILSNQIAEAIVTGTTGNDILTGWNETDTINGNGGDDLITGGQGIDTLNGGSGGDTYIWSKGDGNDTIYDNGTSLTEIDTLTLTDVTSTDVSLSRMDGSNYILVAIISTGEVITVENQYQTSSNGKGIEAIEFSDGVTWNANDILTETVEYITLFGTDNSDTLSAASGANLLRGGLGDDTYLFELGDGNITIDESNFQVIHNGITTTETDSSDFSLYSDADYIVGKLSYMKWVSNTRSSAIVSELDEGVDTLEFGAGIGISDISLEGVWTPQEANSTFPGAHDGTAKDMSISINSAGAGLYTADEILVKNWIGEQSAPALANVSGFRMDTFVFDGSQQLDVSYIETGRTGTTGDDVIGFGAPFEQQTDDPANFASVWMSGLSGNDTLIGGKANDIINGGSGNDTLSGHHSADTTNPVDADVFIFGTDDGNDTITDFQIGTDKILFDISNRSEERRVGKEC